MSSFNLTADAEGAVPIWPVRAADLDDWRAGQAKAIAAWVTASGFKAKADTHLPVPGPDGALVGVVLGLGEGPNLWSAAGLPKALPPGRYRFEPEPAPAEAGRWALGWALGAYRFERYKAGEGEYPELVWPAAAERDRVERGVRATWLVRDLINTPAAHMGPAELAQAAGELAAEHGAACAVIEGEELLAENYPMIHAVGRASPRAPRLIDLTWGPGDGPKVTLVGKGVCFDSGGLDLKSAAGMRQMKKDMGGGATVLGLAHMVMAAGLPVRLRVLVPAVENSVAGEAYRPGDVLATRQGLSVEVGNTDAEGRLVLADALAAADAERPDLLLDCATLTGAARVALGPELPALFTADDTLAADLARHAEAVEDPLWRLPLWAPYAKRLESEIADLNNVSEGGHAGAVTAALFLSRFVTATPAYAHLDLFAWNDKARPGRPLGGEAMAMRALFASSRSASAAERFQYGWNCSKAAPRPRSAARRPSGAPAQARTARSAAVSEKCKERFPLDGGRLTANLIRERNDIRANSPEGGAMAIQLDMQAALNLWRGVLVESVRGEGPDLSGRQMAILLQVYLVPPPHTVRGLAAELGISKPAVTRALDALGKLDFARRKLDESDKRSVLVQRTVKGSVFLSEFAALIAQGAEALDG